MVIVAVVPVLPEGIFACHDDLFAQVKLSLEGGKTSPEAFKRGSQHISSGFDRGNHHDAFIKLQSFAVAFKTLLSDYHRDFCVSVSKVTGSDRSLAPRAPQRGTGAGACAQ